MVWRGGFLGSSKEKESACNAGDLGLIFRSGRSPGEGHGNSLQYSCLENPMDSRTWWATAHGVTQSQTWLSLERGERGLLSFVNGGTMIARDKVVADTERSFTQGLVGRKEKFGSLEVFKENDGLRNLSWMWRKVERERNRWRRWRGQWIECHDGDKTKVPEDCWTVARRF